MCRISGLGFKWPTYGSIIFVSFLLYCEFALVVGDKMLSTTTPSSLEGLTTSRSSADAKKKENAEVAEFITFFMNLDVLNATAQLLTNSNYTKTLEDALLKQLDILRVVEKHYGFRFQHDNLRDCAFEYHKYKQFLVREFSVLLKECKEVVDNVDVYHFSDRDAEQKLLLHACAQRSKTIYGDVSHLVGHIYQLSFDCTVESSMSILGTMLKTDFFEYFDDNSGLLMKELDYLLNANKKHMIETQPENYTESYSWKEMELRNVELEEIKEARESGAFRTAIRNFTNFTQDLMLRHENIKGDKKGNKVILKFAKSWELKDLFVHHLKIAEVEDKDYDDISTWVRTPGIFKVIWLNNHLKELVEIATMDYRRLTNPVNNSQLDLSEAEVFTGISSTFGKLCENSQFHLVGTCTPENHEICKDVNVNWGVGSDQEFLPDKELLLVRNIEEMKKCTCGFRTDCVPKGKEKTCFLIPNFEGQCRGSLGYPCRTHPLGRGSYDESCVSGYCNRQRNSCEQMDESTKIPLMVRADTEIKRLGLLMKRKLGDLVKLF